MSKAPAVIEKSGGQVRLRGTKFPLPVSLDTETKGRIKATIRPNVWTSVPEEIYDFLKRRFDSPRYTRVPDVGANEDHPHAPGADPVMLDEEVPVQFFLEFKE